MNLAISSLCMLSPGARRGFVRARSPQRKSVKADVNSQQGPIHQDSTQNHLPLSCHQYSFPVFASRNFDQPRGSVSKKYSTRHHQYSSEDPLYRMSGPALLVKILLHLFGLDCLVCQLQLSDLVALPVNGASLLPLVLGGALPFAPLPRGFVLSPRPCC